MSIFDVEAYKQNQSAWSFEVKVRGIWALGDLVGFKFDLLLRILQLELLGN